MDSLCSAAVGSSSLDESRRQGEVELQWPSLAHADFATVCEAAIESGATLHLLPSTRVWLEQPINLRCSRRSLRIVGSDGAVIGGDCQCLFNLGGRHTSLELQKVDLHHTGPAVQETDAETGGAVFLMGSAVAKFSNVAVTSAHGLGVWMVQKSQFSATDCKFFDCGRSGLAMFGDCSSVLTNCLVHQCKIHGACARGRTKLTLHNCHVLSCGRRGVYGYQNNTLELVDCLVEGTQDQTRAAVEGAGARDGDRVQVHIENCRILRNAGVGIRLRGAVKPTLECIEYAENSCGDLHIMQGEVNGLWPELPSSSSEKLALEIVDERLLGCPS